jgi:hypothetical protein
MRELMRMGAVEADGVGCGRICGHCGAEVTQWIAFKSIEDILIKITL